jgi:hypothetical protein
MDVSQSTSLTLKLDAGIITRGGIVKVKERRNVIHPHAPIIDMEFFLWIVCPYPHVLRESGNDEEDKGNDQDR